MADQFARQKSTRWVKADVPSYGDWGDEYGDYDDLPQKNGSPISSSSHHSQPDHSSHPEQDPVPPSSSTLVLTIDKLKSGNDDDDDESDSSFDKEPDHPYTDMYAAQSESVQADPTTHANTQAVDQSHIFSLKSDSPSSAKSSTVSARGEPHGTELQADHVREIPRRPLSPLKNISHSSISGDLLPPTPTYQSEHRFSASSPDQDQSDRSYLSDADSIQREPASLNLGSFKDRVTNTQEPVHNQPSPEAAKAPEVAKPEPSAPETLVLSIDRMNTNDDDSSSEDEISQKERYSHNDTLYNGGVQEPEHAMSDDNDDWGYNSGHSSNLEVESGSQGVLEAAQNEISNVTERSIAHSKHKVDTEALDSLINSLSKMENSSGYGYDGGDESFGLDDSLNNNTFTGNHLPTLDSIHDISLPDFEHRFSTDEEVEPLPIKGLTDECLKSKHETFVSNVRQPSIKKAPPTAVREDFAHDKGISTSSTIEKPKEEIIAESEELPENTVEDIAEETVESAAESAESVQDTAKDTAKDTADHSLPQPPKKNLKAEDPDVSRRASTISNATFNMGAWKPNTNKFRDQFVNDNDNESQFNMSIYSKNDAAYKKFTGMGQESNYAESVTNSSFISVPETIEANLHKINEDQSEEEEQPDCVSAFNSPQTLLTCPSPGNSSVPSVLREHQYEKGKFHEQSPHSSMIKVGIQEDEEESNSVLVESKPSESRAASYSATKAEIKKYPVFNWKSIMSISQPIDRIKMLKKARHDEEMYDTGLSSWLNDVLKSTESSSHMQIGKLATHAYQNAQHSDIRRHTSIRSKVSQVRDKLDSGNFEKASSLGKKFFSRGKKLMKQSSD